MHRPLLAACLAVAATLSAGVAGAQAPAGRSTRDGVYTAPQAERGADVYAGFCRSCHAPASHTGVAFANAWRGRPLAELVQYVTERMPKNDPGGLGADQYADVVAYLLRLNAQPAGRAELPGDATALGAIRIDVPEPPSAAPAPRRRRR
jgi:quinoprotein glucose dehydrogenase